MPVWFYGNSKEVQEEALKVSMTPKESNFYTRSHQSLCLVKLQGESREVVTTSLMHDNNCWKLDQE